MLATIHACISVTQRPCLSQYMHVPVLVLCLHALPYEPTAYTNIDKCNDCGAAAIKCCYVLAPLILLAVVFLATIYTIGSVTADQDAGPEAVKLLPDQLTVYTWPGIAAIVRLVSLAAFSFCADPTSLAQKAAAIMRPQAAAWKPPMAGSLAQVRGSLCCCWWASCPGSSIPATGASSAWSRQSLLRRS